MIRREMARQRSRIAAACVASATVAAAAVALLGLSGWFLAGAAAAGASGILAVQAFNYLLPSAAVRGLAVLRTGARYTERVLGHEAALYALARLRPQLLARLMAAPPAQALGLSSGEAAGRLTHDVDAVEALFAGRPAVWGAAFTALAGAGLIALASPAAAGAFLGLLGLQIGVGWKLSMDLASRPAADLLAAGANLKAATSAVLAGASEVRCLGAQSAVRTAVVQAEQALLDARQRLWFADSALLAANSLFMGTMIAVVICLARDADPAVVALAALAAAAAAEGGAGAIRVILSEAGSDQAIRRLDDMASERPAAIAGSGQGQISLVVGATQIDLDPGLRLAISGPSGCGKTTLLNALVGLGPSPHVETELGEARRRALFAFAAQNSPLLSGTVRDNLLMGRVATDETLWSALQDVCLDELVGGLPLALDEWIGDGGRPLSGGERRRLSLARTYVRTAPWLLLDEPTEGLDADTEARVISALEARLARTGQGLILVSHRPAPRTLCDRHIDMSTAGTAVRVAA